MPHSPCAYTHLEIAVERTKLTELSLFGGAAMETVNIHEAKTHLSRLVDQAARGEPFIIAKAGRPLVRVTALDSPLPRQQRRLGFMAGHIRVPDDFDRMGAEALQTDFEGEA